MIIFGFYLEICSPGLVSGWSNSKWLHGALLGLIQPLHGDDTKDMQFSEISSLGYVSNILFFVSNRTSAAGEQVEIQGETNNLNYKVVEKHSTPYSGQADPESNFCVLCVSKELPILTASFPSN